MFTSYTPAEFAAAFPRARNDEDAVSYVAARHHPRKPVEVPAEMIPAGHEAVRVGWTNISGTKSVTRFAIVKAVA